MASFGKDDLVSVFGAEATDKALKLKNDKRDEVSGFKPKLDPLRKTTRLRAGQAPAFASTAQASVPLEQAIKQASSAAHGSLASAAKPEEELAVVEDYDSGSDGIEAYASADDEPQAAVQSQKHSLAADETSDGSDSDSDAEALALARARARARARSEATSHTKSEVSGDTSTALLDAALQKPASAAAVKVVVRAPQAEHDSDSDASVSRANQQSQQSIHSPVVASSSDEDSSSSSGSSSESEEEQGQDWLMAARPVFVPAAARKTIKTQAQLDAEHAEEVAAAQKEQAARREAAQEAVVTVVAAEEAAAAAGDSDDEDMPSDGDHSSEEEANYAAWKLRELKRQQRDLAAQQAEEAERQRTLQRRAMSDAERAADDKRLEEAGLKVFTKEKRSRGFMQKHYHKGVFYMDEDSLKDKNDVRLRVDADAATGADKVDKKILPKAMQVRDFGKKSQSKWTHLAAEDTTFAAQAGYKTDAVSSDLSSTAGKSTDERRGASGMWFKGGAAVVGNVLSRMGGAGDDISSAGRVRRGAGAASNDSHRMAAPHRHEYQEQRRYRAGDSRADRHDQQSHLGSGSSLSSRDRHGDDDRGHRPHHARYDGRRRYEDSHGRQHDGRRSSSGGDRYDRGSSSDRGGGRRERPPAQDRSPPRSSRWGAR